MIAGTDHTRDIEARALPSGHFIVHCSALSFEVSLEGGSVLPLVGKSQKEPLVKRPGIGAAPSSLIHIRTALRLLFDPTGMALSKDRATRFIRPRAVADVHDGESVFVRGLVYALPDPHGVQGEYKLALLRRLSRVKKGKNSKKRAKKRASSA